MLCWHFYVENPIGKSETRNIKVTDFLITSLILTKQFNYKVNDVRNKYLYD